MLLGRYWPALPSPAPDRAATTSAQCRSRHHCPSAPQRACCPPTPWPPPVVRPPNPTPLLPGAFPAAPAALPAAGPPPATPIRPPVCASPLVGAAVAALHPHALP